MSESEKELLQDIEKLVDDTLSKFGPMVRFLNIDVRPFAKKIVKISSKFVDRKMTERFKEEKNFKKMKKINY